MFQMRRMRTARESVEDGCYTASVEYAAPCVAISALCLCSDALVGNVAYSSSPCPTYSGLCR